jgi:penicillin-binding protein 1C
VDEGGAAGRFLEPPVQIAFPPDQAEIEVDPGEAGAVVVKAEGGVLPLTWLVDGVPIESDPARREAEFPAAGLGFHKLSVIDAKGRADRVTIRLK